MRRIGVFMLAAVAVSPPASAHTDFFTGDQLERVCSGGAVDHGWCGGYVAAIASSFDCVNPMDEYRWNSDEDGITVGQLVKVTQKFLGDHPEGLNRTARSLVAAALSQAFPCN